MNKDNIKKIIRRNNCDCPCCGGLLILQRENENSGDEIYVCHKCKQAYVIEKSCDGIRAVATAINVFLAVKLFNLGRTGQLNWIIVVILIFVLFVIGSLLSGYYFQKNLRKKE